MASRVLRVVIAGDASGAKQAFNEAGQGADNFLSRLGELGKAFGEASGATDKLAVLGDKLPEIGKQMTQNVTLPIVGVGAAAAKLAIDFESSFAQIEALVGITGETLDGLKKSTLELAGETGKAPKELAEGLYFLTSAGLDAAKAQEALEVAAKASAAGLGTTAQVADALSSAMNAWEKSQLSAAQAGDILAATATYGKIEADQLASSIGQITAIASNAGVSFAEVGAGIATLSLNGGTAAEQVTKLRAIISAVIKPSEQAAKRLEDVGLSVEGVQKSLREDGLLATIRLLKERFGDNQQALAEWSGTMEALNGILGITGLEASKVDGIFKGVANSGGAVNKAFSVVEETAGQKLNVALAQLKVAGIEIGNAILPAIADVAGAIGKAAAAFAELPEPVQTAVLVMAGLAAAAGPAAVAIGTVSSWASTLTTIVPKATTAVQAFAVRMSALQATQGTVGALSGALKGLGSVLASPEFVLAAGAASLLVLKGQLDETRKAAEQTADALLKLNTQQSGGAKGIDKTVGDLNTQIDELRDKLDDRSLGGLGKYLGDVFTLGKAGIDSSMDWTEQLDALIRKRDQLVNNRGAVGTLATTLLGGMTGPTMDPLIRKMGEFAATVPRASGNVQELTSKLLDLAAKNNIDLSGPIESWLPKLQEAYKASVDIGGAAPAVKPLGDAVADVAMAAEKTEDKLKRLRDETNRWIGTYTDATSADITWFDTLAGSMETLSGNLKNGALGFDLSTKAGRENQRALNDIVRAGGDYIESLRAQGADSDTLRRKKGDLITTIEIEGQKYGLSREQIEKMTFAIGQIPDTKMTTISVSTEAAMARIAEVRRALDTIAVTNPYAYADAGSLGLLDLPRSAAGSITRQGGWGIVGERGAELIWQPPGAAVVPLTPQYVSALAEGSAGGMAGGGTTVIVNQYVRGDVLTERRLAEARNDAVRRGFSGLN